MCSVAGEEDGVEEMVPKSAHGPVFSRSCMKCSENAVIVVRANDPLCGTCFLAMFNHRFRATIGKARVVYDRERTLVAISGGSASTAMLHELCIGVNPVSKRKLRFVPTIVYIDEGAALRITLEEREKICQTIKANFDDSSIPYYLVKLEQLFDPLSLPTNENKPVEVQGGDAQSNCGDDSSIKLKKLFDSATNLTAKESLLRLLRKQLLLMMAKQGGFTKVMLGDSATRTAITMLSNIAQGRGGALPYDIPFVDKRFDENVFFLRPMRECPAKEIAVYNKLNNLEPIVIPAFTTKATPLASIDKLTEDFIAGLQAGFHSTVNTIFRTGDKLAVSETVHSDRKCSLCHTPISDTTLDFKDYGLGTKQQDNSCDDCDGSCKSRKSFSLSSEQFSNMVCYGCSLVLKDLTSQVDDLPACCTQRAVDEIRRNEMREEIKDFLIDGETDD